MLSWDLGHVRKQRFSSMTMHRRQVTPPRHGLPNMNSLSPPSPPQQDREQTASERKKRELRNLKVKRSSLDLDFDSFTFGEEGAHRGDDIDSPDRSLVGRLSEKRYAILSAVVLLVLAITLGATSRGGNVALEDWQKVDGTVHAFSPSMEESSSSRRSYNRHLAMLTSVVADEMSVDVTYTAHTSEQRRDFVSKHGNECYNPTDSVGPKVEDNPTFTRYNRLPSPFLQTELWKYCALALGAKSKQAYLDSNDAALLQTFGDAFEAGVNYASLVDYSSVGEGATKDGNKATDKLVHPALLIVNDAKSAKLVGEGMVRLLVETSNAVLESSPLLLAGELYSLIESDMQTRKKWKLLEGRCVNLADPSTSGLGSDWGDVGVLEPIDVVRPLPTYVDESHKLHSQTDSGMSLIRTSVTPDANSRRVTSSCPIWGGYCCEVFDESGEGILLIRHPLGFGNGSPKTPGQLMAPSALKGGEMKDAPEPYLEHMRTHHKSEIDNLDDKIKSKLSGLTYETPAASKPFISTIRTRNLTPSHPPNLPNEQSLTPNFFEMLLNNDCLPTQKACHKCLKTVKNGKAGSCDSCQDACYCYCKVLCKIRPPKKRVVKELKVHPPRYRVNVERLVPRIVHQTWFEPVTKEKYPNMSRLIESFKQSGWEYNFYDDDTAAEFLSTHFPPEIREAYDAIIPGAFKADLFRYCVLLIRGGVYADMDVILEANLDAAVANDVGFMTPIDEPGTNVGHRSCLWNGLLAVAPGHPFLAKTIEIVVNNIRNRFTSVDYDDMLCPNPVLSVSHSVDTLFTCGPCILGGAINAVLGRHMQDQFEIGDVDIWRKERERQAQSQRKDELPKGKSGDNISVIVRPDDPRLLIPGRTIILQQNKQDMGAHRFTWVEKNLMVAGTDMPDYDDRPPDKEHYSKTHEKVGVYGLKKLYTDNVSADEEIRIVVQKV